MHNFEATNGYQFAPSDNVPDGIVIERPAEDESRWVLHGPHVEALWRYFENDDTAPADGSVKEWERRVVFTFDDKGVIGGLILKATVDETSVEVRVDDELADALRELHDWLGTEEAKTAWVHHPTAVALAMLAVDNSPEQVEAIWANEAQHALWLERAKAAITQMDPNAQ